MRPKRFMLSVDNATEYKSRRRRMYTCVHWRVISQLKMIATIVKSPKKIIHAPSTPKCLAIVMLAHPDSVLSLHVMAKATYECFVLVPGPHGLFAIRHCTLGAHTPTAHHRNVSRRDASVFFLASSKTKFPWACDNLAELWYPLPFTGIIQNSVKTRGLGRSLGW